MKKSVNLGLGSILKLLPVILLLGVGSTGCNDESTDETVCTEIYAYGVTLTIQDSVTQAAISGVTLSATSKDGTAAEAFVESATGTYLGLGEAPGQWTIHIEKSGYASQDQSVVLDSDGCHVIGQSLDVELAPNGN